MLLVLITWLAACAIVLAIVTMYKHDTDFDSSLHESKTCELGGTDSGGGTERATLDDESL